MNAKQMLFLLVLHLLSIIALSGTTKYVDFDEMYSNLFHLPLNGAINESEKGYQIWEFDQNLKFRLEGALFHSEIDKMFISVNESLLNKQRKQIFEKNRKIFDEFISKDEQQQQSLVSNCELWKFWRNLGETFDKFNLLDAETQNLVQNRDVIDYTKPINCSTIEKAFKQIGEAKKLNTNLKKGWAQIYLDDLKLRHFYAIRLLMTPKFNENAEKWKFSNFFDVEMLPNEFNFAFQLRVLHIKNDENKIRSLKYGIKILMGEECSFTLEFYAPALLAPESYDYQIGANKYVQILSIDQTETIDFVDLSVRIYIGRIWQIFLEFKGRETYGNFTAELSNSLDEKYSQFFGRFHEKYSLTLCHKFWFKLANMYNAMLALNKDKEIQIKNLNLTNLTEKIDNEIVEDHCKNLEWLSSTKNAFTEYINKVKDEAKLRLRKFIGSKLISENFEENLLEFNDLMNKFPSLQQMTQFDDEAFVIIEQYQQLLMLKNPIPSSMLESLNTNVIYFVLKEMLNTIIDAAKVVGNFSENLKLGQIVAENFDKQLKSEAEKRQQICLLHSFLTWLIKKNNLFTESGEVKEFLITSGLLESDLPTIESAKSDAWYKPNCENEKVTNKIFYKLSRRSVIEKIHINQIEILTNKYRPFSEFMNLNFFDFPTSEDFAAFSFVDRNFYYKNIFWADNIDEQMLIEIILALKHAMFWIDSKKSEIKHSLSANLQIVAREFFTIQRIITIFDKEMPSVRILCMAMPFMEMLIKRAKEKRLLWQAPLHCLTTDANTIYSDQREFMLPYHQHFFNEFLTKSNKNDMLIKMIRETLGKLNVLEQLISVDELHKHFHSASIREKMIDRKMFNNKKQLLVGHYFRAVCGHTDLERLSNRISADLIVLLIDYFDADKLGQEEMTLRSFMDWWWLYFRVVYESIIEHPEHAEKGSYVINILIQEIDKFLVKNKKLVPKKLNAWTAIEKEAVAETELQWVESQNVPAGPIEIIQKMHFNQLNLLKNDPEVWHENVELYKEIELNKNVRLNLLQILTKENAKTFLEAIGVEYDQKDFDDQKNNQEKNKTKKNNNENLKKNQKEHKKNKKRGKKNGGKKEAVAEASTLKSLIFEVPKDEQKADENINESGDGNLEISTKSQKLEENSNEVEKSAQKLKENSNEVEKTAQKLEENSNEVEKSAQKLEENSNEVEKSAQKLEENSNEVEKSAQKLEENSNEVEKSAQKLEENSNEVEKSAQKLEENSNEVEKTAQKLEENSNEVEKSAQKLEENSNEVEKSAQKLEENSNEVEKSAQKLEENSNEIAIKKFPEVVHKKAKSTTNIDIFSEFFDNSILMTKYRKYILNDFDAKSMDMLALGAYINEIEHRVKLISDIGKLEYLNVNAQNLIEKWEQLKREVIELKLQNKIEFEHFENKLFTILRKILIVLDGDAQLPGLNIATKDEKQNLKTQIHLKNILTLIIEDKELGQNWTNFGSEKKNKILLNLLKIHMRHIRFEELMGKREKMMEQIEIDEELFNKPAVKDEQNIYLLPTFYLHSQQLSLANPIIVIAKWAKNFEDYLTTYLYENIYNAKAFERKISKALNKVTEVVDNWSNKNARLLISGSLLLNAHTIGSDVNLVCLTPGEKLTRIEFMGNDKNAKCLQNKCTERTNASLFCQICEHKSASNLIKIDSESILLIRFTFDSIEFDISLVAVPTIQNLGHKINDNELENLLKRFNWLNSEHKHLIRSLSSYRSTLYISNLLLYNEMRPKEHINTQIDNKNIFNENRKHFRLLLVALKIWAKNNFIYSNKMGFLNGMTLAIMVTKIVLLYPNASIQFLLEKFFLFYSTRRIQMPVQIAKINKTDQELLSNGEFSLLNGKEFDMPTLTPTFPVQNTTRLVTHSNAKVIRREMIKALSKIKAMYNKQFELGAFLDGSVPFTQKYDNFVVIFCIAEQKEKADEFCGFVEWRMRLQIIFDIDKKGGSIETHLYPDVYQQNCNLSTNFVKPSFRANFCKVWLLGISSANISGSINNNLFAMAQQFDTTIKRHYYLNKVKGPTANQLNVDDYFKAMKMELKSVMAKKEELFGF